MAESTDFANPLGVLQEGEQNIEHPGRQSASGPESIERTENLIEPIMSFLPNPEDFGGEFFLDDEVVTEPSPVDKNAPDHDSSLLCSLGHNLSVVVVGASGGIGSAVTDALEADPSVGRVYAFSRSRTVPCGEKIVAGQIDFASERTIARAAAAVEAGGPIHLVVVATGHAEQIDMGGVEASWREMDAASMVHAYQTNAIGPALVAKHFLPLMAATGKSAIVFLSDSIEHMDAGGLGGHYGYRASKVALNAIVQGISHELDRDNSGTVCFGFYPGAVDTPLAEPLRAGRRESQIFSADFAAGRLVKMVGEITDQGRGKVLGWDGSIVAA